MKKSMILAMAGLAVCASGSLAGEGDRSFKRIPVTAIEMTPVKIGPSVRDAIDTYIYDNVPEAHDGTPGIVVYNGNNGVYTPADAIFGANIGTGYGEALTCRLPYANWVGFNPANGALSSYLETLNFGVGHNLGLNVDVYHLFFDDLVTWDTTLCRPDMRRGFLGGFLTASIPTSAVPGEFSAVTVSGLNGAGIFIPIWDNYVVYEQFMGIEFSDPAVADPDAISIFAGDGTALTGCPDGSNFIGNSDDWFYVDANVDNIVDVDEWLFFFGGNDLPANIYVSMSVLYCPADVDFSGFVDIDDQTFFNDHFISGC
jgi:hypothetical protein